MREDIVLAAAGLDFEFLYARRDFQNLLTNTIKDRTYLVIDPIVTLPKYNGVGAKVNTEYTGNFLLLRKSELDEKYSEKVINYIEPLELDLENLRLALISCSNSYTVDWSYQEIVNMFNENMDGLLVKFKIIKEP